jgi:hypothetical protein
MGSMADLVIGEGTKGNIRGFWEHAGILEVDRKIMAYNGAKWQLVPAVLPLQLDADLRRQMGALAETLPDGFCCKEPRLVWTADLWSQWFPQLTLIAVFRNPAGFRRSVAQVWPDEFSAAGEARDSLELSIWEASNRRLLELARRFPCHWICFDDPVPLLKRRLQQVIAQLGRTFDSDSFDSFFIPEERRFSSPFDIHDSTLALPKQIAALYQELQVLASSPEALPAPPVELPRPSRRRGPWTPEVLYLDLLKRCLTRTLFPDGSITPGFDPTVGDFATYKRLEGRDWPAEAETMIGLKRLDNIQHCVTDVLARGIPGDLLEAGVWRGGAAIFMRAVLAAHGVAGRRVWVADSFQGLPQPDPESFPLDAGDRHWELTPYLGIPLDVVRANFERYDLLDEQVEFLPGWFKDTLPAAPIQEIAVLRIDADMYESTFEVLTFLYPKLAAGGYVIIDDYGVLPNCKAAVDDYRRAHAIDSEIEYVDWSGVYWQKH